MNKKTVCFLLSGMIAASALLSGCASDGGSDGVSVTENQTSAPLSNANVSAKDADIDGDNVCTVDINGEIDIVGEGAWYEGNVLTITKGGEYTLSGTIVDGYVYIETDEDVRIILNGLSVYNNNGAALYCYKAKNLYIELAEGSENRLTDSANYSFDGKNESAAENEPNAALYSKSDLIIYGEGSLDVQGSYGLGIRCNDDLTIEGGNITVSAATNGIRGSDSVVIEGGNIKVTAEEDGIKSTNSTDAGRGYILISGGNIEITAGEDGIQAETDLSVTGGEILVTTYGEVSQGGSDGSFGFGGFFGRRSASGEGGYGLSSGLLYGGSDNAAGIELSSSVSEDATSKGVKSGGSMVLSGGKITVDSTDHCIHSTGTLTVTEGEFTLSSSMGKGISAHGELQIDGGKIDVLKSTEGIESKSILTINGGEIAIEASDDGINSGGGSDSMFFGGSDASDGEHDMYINGGYIYINASGDGIDSNGNITINGGTIIVNGPTSGGDGALDSGDFGNSVTINGGVLIAVGGSTQMTENPGSASHQNSLCAAVSLNAGETFAVQDSNGKNIAVFTVKKQVRHIVFSSPDIVTGETYTFYTGVTAQGESKDGLYSENADVTGCDNAACTMTVSSSVTASSGNGGFGGGSGGGFGGLRGDLGENIGGNRDFGDNAGNPLEDITGIIEGEPSLDGNRNGLDDDRRVENEFGDTDVPPKEYGFNNDGASRGENGRGFEDIAI